MDESVRYRVQGEVAWLTLNRPERRNAFDLPMLQLVRRHLEQAGGNDQVRVLVFAAEGSSFCSGADLKGDGTRLPGELAAEAVGGLADALAVMTELPIPVVARVQGPVVGGGLGFVAASDVVVAVPMATFTLREVRVGAVPAVVAVALQSRLSASALRELSLTGESLDVQSAKDLGLVSRVMTDLDAGVNEVVTELLAGAPGAQAATKQLLRELPTLNQAVRWQHAVELSRRAFTAAEASEGMAAFAEKRKPNWQT